MVIIAMPARVNGTDDIYASECIFLTTVIRVITISLGIFYLIINYNAVNERDKKMRLNLICSDDNRKTLLQLLATRGLEVVGDASICLVEKGFALPEWGIAIVFDSWSLNEFLDFLDAFKENNLSAKGSSLIVARRGEGFELVKPEDVSCFIADGNFVYCQTESGKLEVKKKLYELEKEFAEKGFVRVNKSCLLNILFVSEIIPWFGGRLLLKLKGALGEVEVSRTYTGIFKEYIGM